MIKTTIGILICTLLLSTKMTAAEESAARLNDISKAVSAQLLRMKKKQSTIKAGTKKETKGNSPLPSNDKNTANNLQKKDTKAVVKTIQPQKALEKPPKASPPINSATVEKKVKALQQDEKTMKKTVKLEIKKIPPTNLQKNDLLRQQIQNIVNTN